jgi:toxin ParE1/3/4
MTPGYRVLPAADVDLDHQADYLASEASLDTALRFYDAARTTFDKIAQNPGIGQKRETLNPRLTGLRVWRVEGFEKHLIFYRPGDDGVEIVRVLHGARDIDSVLDED